MPTLARAPRSNLGALLKQRNLLTGAQTRHDSCRACVKEDRRRGAKQAAATLPRRCSALRRGCTYTQARVSKRTAAAGRQDISLGLEVAALLAHRVARQSLLSTIARASSTSNTMASP